MSKNNDKKHIALYNAINKFFTEELSLRIMNVIYDTSFIKFIFTSIRMSNYTCIWTIMKCIEGNSFFVNIVKENLPHILMSCLFSPIAMNLALDIYEKYGQDSKIKITEPMIVCIKRHALHYPENKQRCDEFIRYLDTKNLVHTRALLFFDDNLEIVEKYLDKDKAIKEHCFQNALESDACQITNKLIKYYREDEMYICKLTLPTILKNYTIIPKINEGIIVETCSFSKWDLLPYIFENVISTSENMNEMLKAFSVNIFCGHVTLPFLQTLLFQMQKYDIPFTKLIPENTQTLFCSQEIYDELIRHNFDILIELSVMTVVKGEVKYTYSNMFECFRQNKLEFIVTLLHSTYSHNNKRFNRERKYIAKLYRANHLGWTDKVQKSYLAFERFLTVAIEQLNIFEEIIFEYNTLLAILTNIPNVLVLRCMNSLLVKLKKVTIGVLLKDHSKIIGEMQVLYEHYLKMFREKYEITSDKIYMDENTSLDDKFNYIYLYSYIRNDDIDRTEEKNQLLKQFEENKIITEKIQKAFTLQVHIDDIRKILNV